MPDPVLTFEQFSTKKGSPPAYLWNSFHLHFLRSLDDPEIAAMHPQRRKKYYRSFKRDHPELEANITRIITEQYATRRTDELSLLQLYLGYRTLRNYVHDDWTLFR